MTPTVRGRLEQVLQGGLASRVAEAGSERPGTPLPRERTDLQPQRRHDDLVDVGAEVAELDCHSGCLGRHLVSDCSRSEFVVTTVLRCEPNQRS